MYKTQAKKPWPSRSTIAQTLLKQCKTRTSTGSPNLTFPSSLALLVSIMELVPFLAYQAGLVEKTISKHLFFSFLFFCKYEVSQDERFRVGFRKVHGVGFVNLHQVSDRKLFLERFSVDA